MRKMVSMLGAVLMTAGLLAAAPVAQAATSGDLSGTWNASSLRQNQVGYSLVLKKGSSANAYTGVLRFHFQDGTKGPRIPVTLTKKGSTVTLGLPGNKTLAGTIGQDGSIMFAKCQKKLAHVTKATADTMCWFQGFPA